MTVPPEMRVAFEEWWNSGVPTPAEGHSYAERVAWGAYLAGVAAGREQVDECAKAAAEYVDTKWRGQVDPTTWHPIRLPLIRDAVAAARAIRAMEEGK